MFVKDVTSNRTQSNKEAHHSKPSGGAWSGGLKLDFGAKGPGSSSDRASADGLIDRALKRVTLDNGARTQRHT